MSESDKRNLTRKQQMQLLLAERAKAEIEALPEAKDKPGTRVVILPVF